MNISPQLEQYMKPVVAFAVSGAQKDVDVKIMQNSLLLVLAGKGLAEIDLDPGDGPTWVATDALIAVAERNGSIVQLADACMPMQDGDDSLEIAESLKLIVDRLIPCTVRNPLLRQPRPYMEERDEVLLLLAGLQQVRLAPNPMGRDPIWTATPQLLQACQMPGWQGEYSKNRVRVANDNVVALHRGLGLRMDETLSGLTGFLQELMSAQIGNAVDGPSVVLASLLTLELTGEAVAYWDDDGALAWKASDQLRCDFEEGDDDDE